MASHKPMLITTTTKLLDAIRVIHDFDPHPAADNAAGFMETSGCEPLRLPKGAYVRWRRGLSLPASGFPITNSSILCPVLRAAVSQRGCFPRPDQVSDGSSGFRYLGNTRGYFRRSRGALRASANSGWRSSFSRRSCPSRFSSSRFSDVSRTDNT